MTSGILHPGDPVTLTLPDERHARIAPLLRILDRRGRRLNSVDLGDVPPYSMLVVRIDGMELAIPLWHVEGECARLVLGSEGAREAADEETGFTLLSGGLAERKAS